MRLDARVQQDADDEKNDDEEKETKVGAPIITLLALIFQQPEKKSEPVDNRKFQRVAAAHSIAQSLAISALSQTRVTPFSNHSHQTFVPCVSLIAKAWYSAR